MTNNHLLIRVRRLLCWHVQFRWVFALNLNFEFDGLEQLVEWVHKGDIIKEYGVGLWDDNRNTRDFDGRGRVAVPVNVLQIGDGKGFMHIQHSLFGAGKGGREQNGNHQRNANLAAPGYRVSALWYPFANIRATQRPIDYTPGRHENFASTSCWVSSSCCVFSFVYYLFYVF